MAKDEEDLALGVDKVIASARRKASMTGSQSSRVARAALRFRKTPSRVYFPEKDRCIEQVPEEVRRAVRLCSSGEARWPLVLMGPPGVGKTCAGLCVLDYTGGFYYTAQGLAEDMIQAMKGTLATCRGTSVSPPQLWREIKESSLVVLDELGDRAKVSDHAYDVVKKLLDGREGAPLIVLTNLGLNEIEGCYDDRITSRLAAGTLVRINGPDRRLAR